MDRGGVVDRQDVGADVDGEHQFGAAEDDRLDLALAELGDQRLELALAVADDAAGGELLEDDPVDFVDPFGLDRDERDSARVEPAADMAPPSS